MTEFDQHQFYFSTMYDLYQNAPKASKQEILDTLIKYGNFPAFISYLKRIWFANNTTAKTATKNMEFLMTYVMQAKDNIDFGHLADFAQFFFRILCQKAQPEQYSEYAKFLFIIFNSLKQYDVNALYNVLIKCPFESTLLPLTVFGVVVPSYNLKIMQLLFSLGSTAFQKENTKITWIEAFIVFISHKVENEADVPKILSKIESVLNDNLVSTDLKLKLLCQVPNSLSKEISIDLFTKYYSTLFKNLSPKITNEGVMHIFVAAKVYYSFVDDKKLVLEPLFINALPFFFNTPEVEVAALEFAKLLPMKLLQQWILTIIDGPSFMRASLFFVSHFPTDETIHVLFKQVSPMYAALQQESIIYYLKHNKCPSNYVSLVFTILKVSDFPAIDELIYTDSCLYCSSVIKYVHYCYEIEKILHFVEVFEKKKTLPVISAPSNLNHSVLTLSVHFFGYRKSFWQISALIRYFKACNEGKSKIFDFVQALNDESNIWPHFVHNALTSNTEWRDQLFKIGLERLSKQEFQMCIVLVSISTDPTILHNSALLLMKEKQLMPILFTAAATNWEKETLAELKKLLSDHNKIDEPKGFLQSLFNFEKKPQHPEHSKVDVIPIVLNVISVISTYLPYSQLLLDVLFTAFPADQPTQYLTQTFKAITAVCNQMKQREIIHSIIDRMCSNVNGCDIPTFENALVTALNVNQTMTEELAAKISNVYINLVIKDQISRKSKFEEAFFNGNLPLLAFSKVLLPQLLKNEENEALFKCLRRVIIANQDKISFFQRFDHVFIANILARTKSIRKFCIKTLKVVEHLDDTEFPEFDNTSLFSALRTISPFVEDLSKKFSFDTTVLLSDLLFAHYLNTNYNNQVAIIAFFNAVIRIYPERYLDEKCPILPLFFKAIRKSDLKVGVCIDLTYLQILEVFASHDSKLLVPYLFEHTTKDSFNKSHIRSLAQNPTFIPSVVDCILELIKNNVPPSVDIISRVEQILTVLIMEFDSEQNHNELVLSFIIVLCLTSTTFSKWTDFFREPHLNNLTKCIHKFCKLSSSESRRLPVQKINKQNHLLKIIKRIMERTPFDAKYLDRLSNTNFYYLKQVSCAIKMNNSDREFDSNFKLLLAEFKNEKFVIENLPPILVYLADSLTRDRLKQLAKENLQNLLIALFISLGKPTASSTKVNFLLFLRIVLVLDSHYILAKAGELLKVMNMVIMNDVSFLGVEEFSAVLFTIIDIVQDPTVIMGSFNAIIIKMAASLISKDEEERKTANHFFIILFNLKTNKDEIIQNYFSIFSSLYSRYLAYDNNSPKRYVDLALSVLGIALKRQQILPQQTPSLKLSFDEIKIIQAIMLPLSHVLDARGREAQSKYISFLQACAIASDNDNLQKILKLIEEFAVPKSKANSP
ncbi:hypothetical protein TRFO_21424 [Tritrichomonas foetus]|uniref:Uncharacterized protein n=1 Tax=Tritrichomonas foetus TaxID=1144522 RepID=A0A1J4KIW2_9EUKA|nr:hypothetical protein TRFO_21424 [Tritrichomonas foetus]|eukprot:OHT09622.1 hypothetical protein TRFO_21424 [Tritrichomonas foetus]